MIKLTTLEKLDILNAINKVFGSINLELKNVHIRFRTTRGELHAVDRMLERDIDIVTLIKEFRKIMNDRICEFIYQTYIGVDDIAVKTSVGYLVFRVYKTSTGYECRMVTATLPNFKHNIVF